MFDKDRYGYFGDQPTLDDLPSSSNHRAKYEALRDFVTDLMVDVREDGLDCGCRACQRIRRATRALEADSDDGQGSGIPEDPDAA